MSPPIPFRWLLVGVVAAALTSTSLAQGSFSITKEQHFRQVSDTSVVSHPASPFLVTANGAAEVTLLDPAGLVVTPLITSTQRFARVFPTLAAMDAAFPAGTYKMLGLATPDLPFNVAAAYPAASPQITSVSGGTWNGNILVVNPTQTVTLNLSPFADYAAAGGIGLVQARLWGFTEQEPLVTAEVVSQPALGFTVQSTPLGAVTIPAGRLVDTRIYELTLRYVRIPAIDSTSFPGRPLSTQYVKLLRVFLTAQTSTTSVVGPSVVINPPDRTATAGGTTAFSANVTVPSPAQGNIASWFKDGLEVTTTSRIVRAPNGQTLTVSAVVGSDAGSYALQVVNAGGAVHTNPAVLTVSEPTPPRALNNLSSRVLLSRDNPSALANFLVESSGPKTILIRAVGPTLAGLGVSGAHADPTLTVFDGAGTAIATNNDWGGSTALKQAFVTAGAFAFASDGSKDAALLLTASPGLHTVRVSGTDSSAGTVLIEVFDLDTAPRLAYLATRAATGPGADALVAGFVNATAVTQNVVIRAVGPALASAGVAGALADPSLSVFRGATPLVTNNDWDGTAVSDAAAVAGLMPLAAGSRDAAVTASLTPGTYTAQAASGAAGIVQLEIAAIDGERRATFRPGLLEPPAAARLVPLGSGVTLAAPPFLARPRTVSFQWRRNGANLAGATGSTLTLAAAQANDGGEYRVALTNAAGTTFSAPLTLTIGPSEGPVITTQPASRSLVVGGSATFSVVAAGVAPLAYQWLFNGAPIAGATSASLVLSNLQPANAGVYSVRVSNALGSVTSAGAALAAVPVIVTSPGSQSVTTGTPVVLTVVATSPASLTYQWRKDGTNVPGATQPSFTLAAAQPADAGSYTVVVTNTAGSVTSSPATLTVTRSFAGTYFGTFSGGQGTWALVIRSDGVGTYVAYLNNPRGGIIATVLVAPDGSFRTTSVLIDSSTAAAIGGRPVAAAATPIVLSGSIGTTSVTGSLDGVGVGFSGAIEAPGATAAISGIYQASSGSTTTYTVVGPARQVVALTVGPTSVDGGLGSAGGNGAFTVTTPNNTQVTGTATTGGALTATIAAPGGPPVTVTGTATSGLGPPTIATTPASRAATLGSAVTLSPTVSGKTPLTYQWHKDGADIAGATGASLVLAALQYTDAGNYTCRVTNSEGTASTGVTGLTVIATDAVFPTARLVNLSIRTDIGTAGDTFTLGYVVAGQGTAGPRPFLIRAAGPSLGALGVPGTLDDPRLDLFVGSTKVAENDNWGGSAALAATFTQVGAFAFSSGTSRDAAVFSSIATRENSVRVAATGSGTGEVIAELYDAAATDTTAPRLVNVSVLKPLGSGLTMGFVIGGTGAKSVLIRAVGPTLATAFGLDGAVADPQLTLFSGATAVRTNDNWGGTPELTAAFTAVGAFALPPASRDAALLVFLEPGAYTVQVTGVGNTTGTAIVEVYEVP